MLDRFFATLSRRALATSAIAFGILFILVANPPRTACDSQYEEFQKDQVGRLTIDSKLTVKPSKTTFHLAVEQCRFSNNIGGCLEFFSILKTVLRELDATTQKCFADMGGRNEVKDTLWVSFELITRLAWGEAPPRSYREAVGWLDTPNIAIFCELKEVMSQFYGPERMAAFSRDLIPKLPGGSGLRFTDAWPRSILSKGCR
ncbi:MAG: hypothetical protein SGJ18_03350 [Pseudomonadota bacterium]|nr:hypothetical protein [Pseudomonadota bacterium]